MRVAVFRPDDDRIASAVAAIEERGWTAHADPLLAVEPTGAEPETDADVVVFTSTTGVGIALDAVEPEALTAATVAAIGPKTAAALREGGVTVDVVPEEYTSAGLVAALADRVDGRRVEVARSDHGDPALLQGLEDAGATVHETVLYRLTRPDGAGEATVDALLAGNLDAVLFTSSLTVEHLLEAAGDRRADAVEALEDVVVGAIGEPTAATAGERGIEVDVVPGEATFPALLEALRATVDGDGGEA